MPSETIGDISCLREASWSSEELNTFGEEGGTEGKKKEREEKFRVDLKAPGAPVIVNRLAC